MVRVDLKESWLRVKTLKFVSDNTLNEALSGVSMSAVPMNSMNNEIILAIVRPAGVESTSIIREIEDLAKCLGAMFVSIRLVELLDTIESYSQALKNKKVFDSFDDSHKNFGSAYKKTSVKMKKGTYLRQELGPEIFALYALARIAMERPRFDNDKPKIILIDSIKHPKEIDVLREAYGNGLFVLGINSSRRNRVRSLIKRGMTEPEATELICRDESEKGEKLGQQMTKAFEKADAFADEGAITDQVERFLKLILGKTILSPRRHELHMQMAISAAAMSADLSRQVGAALVSPTNELLAIGYNEVPKAGGGLYAEGDSPDYRDVSKKVDPNHIRRKEMLSDGARYHSALEAKISEIADEAEKNGSKNLVREVDAEDKAAWTRTEDRIDSLIEFHRAIHAEMEVILSCARKGVSTKGSTLFTTTFPCHNCTRLIIGAGIAAVHYIEAYPKSLAEELHNDAVDFEGNDGTGAKVVFKRFSGISPRRFLDLFSTSVSNGVEIPKKDDKTGLVSQSLGTDFKTRFPISAIQADIAEYSAARSLVSKELLDSKLAETLKTWISENKKFAAA